MTTKAADVPMLTRDDLFRMLEEADVDRRRLRVALKPLVDAHERRVSRHPERTISTTELRAAWEAYHAK